MNMQKIKNIGEGPNSALMNEGGNLAGKWTLTFILRLLICIVIQLLYHIEKSSGIVYIMILISLFTLSSLSMRNNHSSIISFITAISFIWMVVVFVSFQFGLPPIQMTQTRWHVFSSGYLEMVVLMSAQVVFLISALARGLPTEISLKFKDNKRLRLLALLVTIITSYIINGDSFVFAGGYIGNQNKYWSGLPAFFVVSLAAWMLLHKRFGFNFFITLNLIVIYWISTGNRSEVLMAFLLGNTFVFLSVFGSKSIGFKSIFGLAALFIAFLVFSWIGSIRHQGSENSGIGFLADIFGSLVQDDRLQVSTIGSSIYSTISAMDIAKNHGFQFGETFLGRFINIFPSFIPVPWERYVDPYFVYSDEYQTIGGFGFIGESYLNFGMAGIIIVLFFMVLLLRLLIVQSQKSFIAAWLFVSIALYAQRIFYYGFVYLHNTLLIFLGLISLYFFYRITARSRSFR